VLIISNHKSRAVVEVSRSQPDKPVTWEEIQRDMKSLVGMEPVKEQLLQIARTLTNIKDHQERHGLKLPPLHFLVEGPTGGGKKRVAQILGKLLRYYGLAEGPLHVVTPQNIDELPEVSSASPIYVPLLPRLIPDERRSSKPMASMAALLWFHLELVADQQSIILGVDPRLGGEFLETVEFASEIQLKVSIPAYTWADYLAYARRRAAASRFKLSQAAVEQFRRCLAEEQQAPDFLHMVTVQKLVDRAIMNYYIDPGQDAPAGRQYAALQPQHFRPRQLIQVKQEIQRPKDALAELSSLVGLKEVKERVSQLMALVNLEKRRREQGLPAQPIMTHMAFSGSPGTGKTTVARLVGQALKELGVLNKGHLVEAAREDLVGQYVGHTAAKTAEVVEKALGGVLYIDECYSLNGGHNVDFGKEAVATLVKKMEDARDNLTVIFSGYGRDMEEFLQMNPGLRSRIQFQIHFPDYSAQELMEIFLKLCQDEGYELEPEAARELETLLQGLHENKQDNFANGRLVRSLFERSKLALAARVWKKPEATSLSLLLPEDIKGLTSYEDVARGLRAHRKIGFQAVGA
jgi:Holliday junction resolvasome RuvABC ATP-dependent DNA helicase subunit